MKHVIVVGCGSLGSKVVKMLEQYSIPFVVIVDVADKFSNEVVLDLVKKGIKVIYGDARVSDVLKDAGIENAYAIIITINNDIVNTEIAKKAKELNPNIRTVVRIFNDELAEILQKTGYVDLPLSTSLITHASFVLGAFFKVSPKDAPLLISANHKFAGKTIAELENLGLLILAIKRGNEWFIPQRNDRVMEGDIMAIVGNIKEFLKAVTSV